MTASRQYTRDDVDFDSFYSGWMKTLAKTKTRSELESLLTGKRREAVVAANAHLRSIQATGSMQGQSMRRAHAGNVCAAAGDYAIAINGALEIYDLFPEFAKAQ